MKILYLLSLFSLTINFVYSQADAGADKVNCFKTGVTIGGQGDSNPNWCYSWSPTTGLDNPHVFHPLANPGTTTIYTLTVIGPNFSFKSSDEVTVHVLEGFTIDLLESIVCDGNEVGIKLKPVPASVPMNGFMSCLSNVNFMARTAETYMGNPAGTSQLTFDPLNNNAESKIQRALWYSTQADHCNSLSQYEVSASATINGVRINSSNKVDFFVEATLGRCLNGQAEVTQVFSGDPGYITIQLPDGKWQTSIIQNTFKKDVKAEVTYTAPPNSQFHDMVKGEEEFHKGQFEGTTSTIFSDLLLAENVIKATNASGPFTGNSQAEAEQKAMDAFIIESRNERNRSALIYLNERECEYEKEAKNAVGASYIISLKCTYPDCK